MTTTPNPKITTWHDAIDISYNSGSVSSVGHGVRCRQRGVEPKTCLFDVFDGVGHVAKSGTFHADHHHRQHDVIPTDEDLLKPITHVVLAFTRSEMLFDQNRTEWPLFRSVASARESFFKGTKILVAIGGWGDTGFSVAAKNDSTRKAFALGVARMIEATGADGASRFAIRTAKTPQKFPALISKFLGVDVDWEYPAGNGEDYKQIPNEEKMWEIDAYPQLLEEIRSAIGPDKLMTAAVPGLERDMIAFTPSTVTRLTRALDLLNVMAYDLMNRRDFVTKHHTSINASRTALQAYISRGAPSDKLNLGFAFYVKWFRTDKDDCEAGAIGCKSLLLEDPVTGGDLGRAGGFSFHDEVPAELKTSFHKALLNAEYDSAEGATYYWDPEEGLWWTFDIGSNGDIERKAKILMQEMDIAGVFAYGLGEDAPTFAHLAHLQNAIKTERNVLESPGYDKDEL